MNTLCVSLETAKKLKAAGWTKPTHFRYGPPWDSKDEIYLPTAEEVLRELPICVETGGNVVHRHSAEISKTTGGYSIHFGDLGPENIVSDSLSEAAAQMWLWCVENGYIKTEAKP